MINLRTKILTIVAKKATLLKLTTSANEMKVFFFFWLGRFNNSQTDTIITATMDPNIQNE